jgi:hypothetical protein
MGAMFLFFLSLLDLIRQSSPCRPWIAGSSPAMTGGGEGSQTMSVKGALSFSAADWLCLAAAPTFALMALLTGVLGGGPADMICSAAHGGSLFGGMVPMYWLMSAFHAAPWLRLISRRRS